MFESVELKCFRQHRDLRVAMKPGLNVIRGENEAGKSGFIEGATYVLFGHSVLRDSFEETVTWGCKVSELWGRVVFRSQGVSYVFTRSKAGAEVNYSINGKDKKVTGQKEVTSFATQIIGADPKLAAFLMLATQNSLRGALDEGPSAVGSLMAKLADFTVIDRILKNADSELTLGSDKPILEKLTNTQRELADCRLKLVDPESLGELRHNVSVAEQNLLIQQAALAPLQEDLDQKAAAKREGEAYRDEYQRRLVHLTKLELQRKQQAKDHEAAVLAAQDKADPSRIAELQAQVQRDSQHRQTLDAHRLFTSLVYPAQFWDEPKDSFEAAEREAAETGQKLALRVAELGAEIRTLNGSIIRSGKCQTCGQDVNNDEHVHKRNAEINAQVAGLTEKLNEATREQGKAQTTAKALAALRKAAKPFEDALAVLGGREDVAVDRSHYPPRISWTGPVPAATPGTAAVELQQLQAKDRAAALAEGRAQALATSLAALALEMDRAEEDLQEISLPDMEALEAAFLASSRVFFDQQARVTQVQEALNGVKTTLQIAERDAAEAERRVQGLEARIAEYETDLKTLAFNNTFVAKVKKMKPMVTDHLWNQVLSAVSTFFSQLRGQPSIVTKDNDGFKVNGQSVKSLSGSTLDVLALAIRVALTKTFLPQSSFIILDEPAQGCSVMRTQNVLGFLASVGLEQTILASHDVLSESVADNVITLGE